jgi:DNA repair protein RadD
MLKLRYYQDEAIEKTIDYWSNGGGNPLVELATGTGKSLVIAEILRRLIDEYPSLNVLMLTHVRELVRQNYDELLSHWPGAPVGINSAGLGRRDRHNKILFASIQSVAGYDVGALGRRGLVIVDEAHLIPHKESGQYRTVLEKLCALDPDLRVLGLTATPYRLDSGRLDEGKDRLFDKTVYSYDIGQAVDDGFLVPLVARGSKNSIDVSNVGRRGGEFIPGQLEEAASAVTQAACDEICTKATDRKKWLVFCSGVDHAYATRNAMRERGITCETITGKTPKGDRDRIIRDFKSGRVRCLTNANVLTTGFNVPGVDMIAMLRPTLSTSLYVQMLGRGTRLDNGKEDCLVLDFSGNVMRHGPVDGLNSKDKKNKAGRADISAVAAKECPNCGTLVGLRSFSCEVCDYEWPRELEPKHNSRCDENIILLRRDVEDKWIKIDRVRAYSHLSQAGKFSMRVEYECGLQVFKEYVPIGQLGYPGDKARKWLRVFLTHEKVSLDEAVDLFNERSRTGSFNFKEIQVRKDGSYWRVSAYRNENYSIDERLNVYARKDLKYAG